VSHRNVAGHHGRGLLSFRDGAARDDDAMTGGRKGGGGRLADAAVAAGDNDSHVADMQCFSKLRSLCRSKDPSLWPFASVDPS
jgi:hypothetical protein